MGTVIAKLHGGWLKGAVLACVILPLSGRAVTESITENFVATATIIQGNGGNGARLNSFALQSVTPAVYVGTVSSLNGVTLTDASATWLDGQFAGSSGLHYVEFESGVLADIVGTSGGSKTLTLAGNLTAAPSLGSTFRIRKHLTVADVFGSTNQAGLQPGFNGSQADNIILHVPQTQESLTIFYSNVPGYNGWFLNDYTPASNVVIYPEQGLMVRSKTSRTVSLFLNGARRSAPFVAPVFGGFNLVGSLTGGARKLSELNLYSGNPATGVAAGSNPDAADILILLNPDTTTASYFYSDYPGFEGWFDSSFRPAGNVSIVPGTAFFIQRKQPRGTFYWKMP